MAKLVWDADTQRLYETGVSKGVLYVRDKEGKYPKGVAWNGLTAFTESPGGAEPTDLYADNIKYLSIRSAETFGGTLEAYMYPPEFYPCDGLAEAETGVVIGQQDRTSFGFSYQTILGNDSELNNYGYKIHLIYGATASPSEKGYSTVNDSPDAVTFSWEIETTPVNIEGFKPTALMVIDSTKVQKEALAALEKVLYGDEETEARLPLPDEVVSIIRSEG